MPASAYDNESKYVNIMYRYNIRSLKAQMGNKSQICFSKYSLDLQDTPARWQIYTKRDNVVCLCNLWGNQVNGKKKFKTEEYQSYIYLYTTRHNLIPIVILLDWIHVNDYVCVNQLLFLLFCITIYQNNHNYIYHLIFICLLSIYDDEGNERKEW